MKPSVRYVVRAVKYFCWFVILFALIISILMLAKSVPADGGIDGLFVNGWKSVLEIAAVFFVFSAVYPKFGYQKKMVDIPGEWSEVSEKVKDYFVSRGDYILEDETDEKLCLRAKKIGLRIARRWEDRLTITPVFGGILIEGPSKDVARIASSMDYQLNKSE